MENTFDNTQQTTQTKNCFHCSSNNLYCNNKHWVNTTFFYCAIIFVVQRLLWNRRIYVQHQPRRFNSRVKKTTIIHYCAIIFDSWDESIPGIKTTIHYCAMIFALRRLLWNRILGSKLPFLIAQYFCNSKIIVESIPGMKSTIHYCTIIFALRELLWNRILGSKLPFLIAQ